MALLYAYVDMHCKSEVSPPAVIWVSVPEAVFLSRVLSVRSSDHLSAAQVRELAELAGGLTEVARGLSTLRCPLPGERDVAARVGGGLEVGSD